MATYGGDTGTGHATWSFNSELLSWDGLLQRLDAEFAGENDIVDTVATDATNTKMSNDAEVTIYEFEHDSELQVPDDVEHDSVDYQFPIWLTIDDKYIHILTHDNFKLLEIEASNLITSSSGREIAPQAFEIVHQKCQEDIVQLNINQIKSSILETNKRITSSYKKKRKLNNPIQDELMKRLRSMKRLTKDLKYQSLRLHIKFDSIKKLLKLSIKFKLKVIYKPNTNNKFNKNCNRLLDSLFSTLFDEHTENIGKTHSLFIQKPFLEQTIRYTKDKMSNLEININNEMIPDLQLNLLPFQLESVQWMFNKEINDFELKEITDTVKPHTINKFLNDKIAYGYEIINVDTSRTLFWNKFTNFILPWQNALELYQTFHQQHNNNIGTRGLLSEEMGLGKTIEIIALILLNRRYLTSASQLLNNMGKQIHRTKCTLIICPNPLLRQWINEIKTNTRENSLSIFHYMGYNDVIKQFDTSNINQIVTELSNFDIIITTYDVINLELHYAQYNANLRSRRYQNSAPKYDYSSPLSLMEFWRILLDEVQMLKSDNTQIAKCTSLLSRIHTWGVSGTPIQKIKDFQVVLSYLRIKPFTDKTDIINNVSTNFVKSNQNIIKTGIKFSLKHLMSYFIEHDICIRHIKNDVIDQIHLPKQTKYILPLQFNPIELDNYLNLWNEFIQVSGYGPNGENETRLSNIQLNQWLMRLRYICCHAIIPENIINMFESHSRVLKRRRRQDNNSSLIDETKTTVHNIDDILKLMIQDAEDNLDSLYRENIQLKIKYAQAKMELQDHPVQGIEILNETIATIKKDLMEKFKIEDVFSFRNFDSLDGSDKIKIGSYLDLLHQCYFFIGTGHYFQGSKKLELLEEEKEKNKLLNRDLPVMNPFSEEEMKDIEKSQLEEKKNYQLAELLRKQILQEKVQKVDEVVKEVQSMFKESKKRLITEIEIIQFDDKNDYSTNLATSHSFQLLSPMIKQFNEQAVQLNKLFKELVETLSKPITKEYDEQNEDEKAEEYAGSLDDQDKIFAILHCMEEILSNRETVINSDEDQIKLNTKKSLEIDPTYSEYHAQLLHDLVLIENGSSLKSIFTDLKNSKIVRNSLNIRTTNSKNDFEDFEDYLLQYQEEVPRINKEIKSMKESTKKLNLIYNARVEYYSQLQKISDSLVSLIQLEPQIRNQIMKNIKDNNKYNSNLNKISQIESRIKYLTNLNQLKELINQGKSFTCTICLSIIYDGSINRCGHFFCQKCIHNWLKNNKTCPICKRNTNKLDLYNFKFKNEEEEKFQKEKESQLILDGNSDGSIKDIGKQKINEAKVQNEPNTLTPPSSSSKQEASKIDHDRNPEDDNGFLFRGKYVQFPHFNEVLKIKIKEKFGAKIDFMVQLILYLQISSQSKNEPPPQILIYSQNLPFLKIITHILKLQQIKYLTCFNNTKTISNTIDKFKKDNTMTCLLMNVKTLGSGLNLLNAQHIFLLDPIINHNDELQAMSRNNRIGQKNETFIWNFMICDSVEENIFKYKCQLENEKMNSLNSHHKVVEENLNTDVNAVEDYNGNTGRIKEMDTEDEIDSYDISANASETVSDEHLWHCFFS